MKIAYLDPVGPEHKIEGFLNPILKYLDDVIEVDYYTLKKGGSNLEIESEEKSAIIEILSELKELENLGYDGAVIGCFYDPGLEVARHELKKMVVSGPFEASTNIAFSKGHQIGIIAGHILHKIRIEEIIKESIYEENRFVIEVLEMTVDEMLINPVLTEKKMKEAAFKVKSKGVDAIIPGCTIELGRHELLRKIVDIPVIDPVLSSILHVQNLINTSNVF